MKIHQIISESELKEWNPKDALMKKFGSQTAATKMDIDSETKKLSKEFTAYYKNTPDGAPTTELLFNYLKKKGLPIGSEKDIVNVLAKLGKRTSQKVGGIFKKAGAAVAGGVKKAGQAVAKGVDKVKKAGAQAIQPEPKQMELPLSASMYESIYHDLKEESLQPADVTRIIQHYVKSGFAGTAGGFDKSKYAGGSTPSAAGTKKAGAKVSATKSTVEPGDDIDINKAIEIVKAHGYQVTK